MTVHETMKILNFLRGCYPAFYRRATPDEADNTLMAWSVLFADEYYTYDMVLETVKRYVTGSIGRYGNREMYDDYGGDYYFDSLNHSARLGNGGDYKRFPPSPGEIVELLSRRKSFFRLKSIMPRSPFGGI